MTPVETTQVGILVDADMAAKKGSGGSDLSELADDLSACADALTNACHRLGELGSTTHVQVLQRAEPQVRALAEYLDEHDTEILAALEAAGSTKEKADG